MLGHLKQLFVLFIPFFPLLLLLFLECGYKTPIRPAGWLCAGKEMPRVVVQFADINLWFLGVTWSLSPTLNFVDKSWW